MYGNWLGDEWNLSSTCCDSSFVRSSCLGIKKWVLTLKGGTSSSAVFLFAVFLVPALVVTKLIYLYL